MDLLYGFACAYAFAMGALAARVVWPGQRGFATNRFLAALGAGVAVAASLSG